MWCHKKTTLGQFWDLMPETNRTSSQYGCLQLIFVSEPKTQCWLSVVFLLRLLFLVTDSKFQSLPTLSSHNSCSKPPNLENYHIFGILRTSAFRWAIGKPAGVNIVRLAAAWKFLPEGHQKSPKTDIFCFSANYLRFWYWNTYPG